MATQGPHALLPVPDHDEAARQAFVETVGRTVLPLLPTINKAAFESRVGRRLAQALGDETMTRHHRRRAMTAEPMWQMTSALRLTHQETLWDSVTSSVERQLPQLVQKAVALRTKRRYATLDLDSSIGIPRYLNAVDIHMMPGNYDRERLEDDVSAGAIYDRGVFLRALGLRGAYGEDYGTSFGAYVRAQYPELNVRRVLELGCACGGSTLGLADAFPEADVFAVDVAAPMLRYAQARMESLGKKAHFQQQNAEHLSFESNSFDVVVGFALLHETSAVALPAILKEAHRVLNPGGLALFRERPAYSSLTASEVGEIDWDTYYNAEPFYGRFFDLDRKQIFIDAGFAAERVIAGSVPSASNAGSGSVAYPGFGAQK